MRDHAVVPAGVDVLDSDHRVVLLRRVLTTVGFLFGLGVLALVTAGQAGADERAPEEPRPARAEAPVSGLLHAVTELPAPATDAVSGFVDPVVHPVAETVAPVARPVVETVSPVVQPILEPVLEPALESVVATVAPVTEPVTGPLLRAVEPVLTPVSEAVGAQDAVSGLSGHAASGDTGPVPPAPEPVAAAPAQVVTEPAAPLVSTGDTTSGRPDGVTRSFVVETVESVERAGTGTNAQPGSDGPGDGSGLPSSPGAVTGGFAATGSGGQHAADGTTPAAGVPSDMDGVGGRAPPGTEVALSWLAYANRDHPG